jgi:hypothetical protein
MNMRILVTGSRTWTDTQVIRKALAEYFHPEAILVTGACPRGADAIAEHIWRSWGGQVERHPADWHRYGRSAGYRRNADMVSLGAVVCLAFIRDASSGATHTAQLAEVAGITTKRYQVAASLLAFKRLAQPWSGGQYGQAADQRHGQDPEACSHGARLAPRSWRASSPPPRPPWWPYASHLGPAHRWPACRPHPGSARPVSQPCHRSLDQYNSLINHELGLRIACKRANISRVR